MKKACQDYYTDEPESPPLGLEDWCVQRRRASPQFQFWNLVFYMLLAIYTLIRSFREGKFELYRYALYEMVPYFFANNNVNYARWIPIHLRDMMVLEEQNPDVGSEFHKGLMSFTGPEDTYPPWQLIRHMSRIMR